MSDTDFTKMEECRVILDYVDKRFNKKKNTNILTTGVVGGGKSSFDLRLQELYYKERFDEVFPINHIANSIEEAVLLAKGFKRLGEGIIVEEVSVHASRRDALTTKNKLYNKFLDVVRIKQIFLVMNAPHISFVDKHILMATDAWINCEKVDFKNNVVIARPLWLQTSPHRAEPYKHKFINRKGYSVDYCFTRMPSEELWKEYSELKSKSNDEIFEEIILKLRHDKKEQLKKIGQKVLSPKELDAYNFALDGFSSKEAGEVMDIPSTTFNKYLRSAKNKLKTPDYARHARELAKMEQNRNKTKMETPIVNS